MVLVAYHFQWEVLWLVLLDQPVFFSQFSVHFVLVHPRKDKEGVMHLVAHCHLVDYIKHVFLYGFEVWHLEEAHLSEHFELVEFVDQPPHHVDEALDLACELVCKVDLILVVVEGGAVLARLLLD